MLIKYRLAMNQSYQGLPECQKGHEEIMRNPTLFVFRYPEKRRRK